MACKRTYAVAISKQSLVWVGPRPPADSECDVSREFMKYFEKTIVLNGDVYAKADTPENVASHRQHLAQVPPLVTRIEL